jgi:hypothetical protein
VLRAGDECCGEEVLVIPCVLLLASVDRLHRGGEAGGRLALPGGATVVF